MDIATVQLNMIFTPNIDQSLLEIICDEEPWRCSHGATKKFWEDSASQLKKIYPSSQFTAAAISKRFKHLISVHKSSESKNKFRSGIYEPFSEQSKILVQIDQKMKFFNKGTPAEDIQEKENQPEIQSEISDKMVSSPVSVKRSTVLKKVEERNILQIDLIKKCSKFIDVLEEKINKNEK